VKRRNHFLRRPLIHPLIQSVKQIGAQRRKWRQQQSSMHVTAAVAYRAQELPGPEAMQKLIVRITVGKSYQ
jgi:hypothetical protein